MPLLISPTQSVVVLGLLITDNVLVAYEVLHTMHYRNKGKIGSLSLKLDIHKVYNRVEWVFLRSIMIKLGLSDIWIDRVMTFVTLPFFSILNNGKTFGKITPSRGLRQRDPLSSYLFLLCAEGFTSLLAKEKMDGRIHGVFICRRAPIISHLLFADDSLLFCQASQKKVNVINEILQVYAKASGQRINMEKSLVYFSNNTPNIIKDWTKRILGVKEVERFEKYLGLPTLIRRVKYQTFSYLKDRVWKKLQGWKGKLLFKARKEVLIKVVAQSIPTYTMGVFLLPPKLYDELNAMCAKLW